MYLRSVIVRRNNPQKNSCKNNASEDRTPIGCVISRDSRSQDGDDAERDENGDGDADDGDHYDLDLAQTATAAARRRRRFLFRFFRWFGRLFFLAFGRHFS